MQGTTLGSPISSLECFSTILLGLPRWPRWWRICLQCRIPRFDPQVEKIPWRREWLPTLGFLLGEFQAKTWTITWQAIVHEVTELDTTEQHIDFTTKLLTVPQAIDSFCYYDNFFLEISFSSFLALNTTHLLLNYKFISPIRISSLNSRFIYLNTYLTK